MLSFLISFFFIFCAIYCAIIIVFVLNWQRNGRVIPDNPLDAGLTVSLLIPVRNEERDIGKLIDFLVDHIPIRIGDEVLLIDDGSVDNTVMVAKSRMPGIKVLHVDESVPGYWRHAPKKSALMQGIAISKGDILVFIDGDCTPVHPFWLDRIRSTFHDNKVSALTAPVILSEQNGFFDFFQQLELLAWTAVTSGGYGMKWFTLANGGNMAVRRAAFDEIGGFSGDEKYASGDDVFLMEKLQKRGYHVQSLSNRDAVASTRGVQTWSEYFNQKVRWGSKTAGSTSIGLKLVAAVMLSVNFTMYPILIIGFLTSNGALIGSIALTIFMKYAFDHWMIKGAANLYKVKVPIFYAIAAHIFYPISIVIAVIKAMLNRNYQWKGRKLK